MKVILLSGLAAFAIAAPAIAADLPIKSGPFVPAPAAPNWSGFYLGGNIGYLVQHDPSSLTDFTQPAAPVSNPALSTASATSFTGSGSTHTQLEPSALPIPSESGYAENLDDTLQLD